jgi:hypothetical protein
MAWRIHEQVIRAVIDNRVPGKVTGSVWLAGRDQPLELDLTGNAWPDMAGCLLTVENPPAVSDPLDSLATEQRGVCGDMTASRKVKIPTVPLIEWVDSHRGEPFPFVWGNGVYLEWYSERNGRVVIELNGCSSTLSEPVWRLTPAQEETRQQESAEAFAAFMSRMAAAMRDSRPALSASLPDQEEAGGDGGPTTAEAEQRARIEALKQRVREVTGEPNLSCGEGPTATLDEVEGFWRRVLEYEQCPVVRVRELLAGDGIKPPAPRGLRDAVLKEHLDTMIQGLADRGVFLQYTDHLSDRELYRLLYKFVLEDEIEVAPAGTSWSTHVDMSLVGLAKDEDGSANYLRFYADQSTREQWANDFPGDELPPHVDPPNDRDQWLPQPE